MSLAEGPATREGQIRSPFTTILETLCSSAAGAVGVGLVDEEGECVDFAFMPRSDLPAFSIKLCGAYWQLAMRTATACAKLEKVCGTVQQLWVDAELFGYVALHLHAGYVLVLICRPALVADVSPRALRQAEVELAAEAGWPLPHVEQPYWRRVEVLLNKRGEPKAISFSEGLRSPDKDSWQRRVDMVGQINDFRDVDAGFDVVADDGEPLRVVRERSGQWYAGAGI